MSKKTFYIILIVIGSLILIGGLVWYFLSKPKESAAPVSGGANFTAPGQIKNETNLKVISKGPIISASLDDYGVLWYYDYSGQLWQFSGDGTIEYNDSGDPVAINQPITDLTEIIWPKVFSPNGKKIVYQKNNSLFTSDPDGKNQRTLISSFRLRDVILYWPKTNQIGLTSRPSGLIAGSAWLLDTRNLSFTKLIDDLFGLETLWAPDGSSFIYSYTDQNGQNTKLAIYNKKGEKRNLNNTSTVIDKCVWASDSINVFCAVPKNWPEGMVLPDDYYKKVNLTLDDVWKINIETDEKTLIAKDVGDISSLAVSENESNLFFILKENQFLYKLIIK